LSESKKKKNLTTQQKRCKDCDSAFSIICSE
jgi:hypothetical protein